MVNVDDDVHTHHHHAMPCRAVPYQPTVAGTVVVVVHTGEVGGYMVVVHTWYMYMYMYIHTNPDQS